MTNPDEHASSHDKCRCVDQCLEMNARASEFWTYRSYPGGSFNVDLKFANREGDKIEIKVTHRTSLIEAVDEAYARFIRILGKLPEFDEVRMIEHEAEAPRQPIDDEIPY